MGNGLGSSPFTRTGHNKLLVTPGRAKGNGGITALKLRETRELRSFSLLHYSLILGIMN